MCSCASVAGLESAGHEGSCMPAQSWVQPTHSLALQLTPTGGLNVLHLTSAMQSLCARSLIDCAI